MTEELRNEDFAGTRKNPSKKVMCPQCNGKGTYKSWTPRRRSRHVLRGLQRPRICPCFMCNGTKKVYAKFLTLYNLTVEH